MPKVCHILTRFTRSISINPHFAPTPRGIFDIRMMYQIPVTCNSLSDPHLFRAIFLTAFFAFLRMSNIACHIIKSFDSCKHFLRQDVVFTNSGAQLIIKWTKIPQDHISHHIVQLTQLENIYLCPVRALRALFSSRRFPHNPSLFVTIFPPYSYIIDTHIRNASLKLILHLFIYFGFYVAFNTVQVISRWVVGRADETSAYSCVL